ncbi:zinc finger protein 492-like [Mytilus trossulus]|uniref:zinc finger protein 492-like n=1 Tax=Mytilus trossulus TaxID=6551 RepID=UPI003007B59E
MGLVFGQTETLLLPSVSVILSKFLDYSDSELSEKLKSETRVKISRQDTDSEVYVFLGSFVDIIRANGIINTFIQHLSENVNDSLCKTSTLVSDLNEKQKCLLLQNAEIDQSGNFNDQEPRQDSNICIQEIKLSKNEGKIKTVTVDTRKETKENITKEDILLTDTCNDTNILSDFVSAKENQRRVNKEENASASVLYKHALHENPHSQSAQNSKVEGDVESLQSLVEKDHVEKIQIPSFESENSSERNESSGENEIVQTSDKDNEIVNDYHFSDDNTPEENNISNQGIKMIRRKRKDQHICKVDFDDDHPDFSPGSMPDEIKDLSYEDGEEPVFIMQRNAGRLTRDKDNQDMAKTECRFCPFVNVSLYARSKKQLKQHYRRNHAYVKPVHKCELCSESFCTKAQLYEHKRSKHIFINCETCGTSIRKSNYLKRSRIHEDVSDTYKLEDDKCETKFTPKLSLQQPEKNTCTLEISADEKGSFECEICKQFWLDKTSLDLHIKFKHGRDSETQKYPCELCKTFWPDKTSLDFHMKLKHSKPQEYPCEVCGKIFPNLSRINQHKKIHDDIYPFSCDVCHKSFKKRNCLKRHKETHTGARDYFCKVCGKTYTLASSLERHSLVHKGAPPFVCSYSLCREAFYDRSTLRKHMIRHTTENPRKKCKV